METTKQDAFVFFHQVVYQVSFKKDSCINQLVFPGDFVVLNESCSEIKKVLEHHHILSRATKDYTKRSEVKKRKIIAVNIDYAVIVVSFQEPEFHPSFVDRYMVLLGECNIPYFLVVNKRDLKTNRVEKLLDTYRSLGIDVIETSVNLEDGICNLKSKLYGKQVVFLGHSGVGKSSLVKRLVTDESIQISCVSEKTKKGCHTTTHSKCYVCDFNTLIIDTPGVGSLSLPDISPLEVQNYFKEFSFYRTWCKFDNCIHIFEKNCGVKEAVMQEKISKERYESYVKLVYELDNK